MIYSKRIFSYYVHFLKTISNEQLVNQLLQLGHEVEEIHDMKFNNLVIGEIIECQDHPDSDHLHVCQVKIGSQVSQIVCGAKNPRTGIKVVVALPGCSLPAGDISSTTLRGVESNGMLCDYGELGLDNKYINLDPDTIIELDASAPVGADAAEYLGLNDTLLDVSLTANRGDCLSIKGMVRDLAALNDCSITINDCSYDYTNFPINLNGYDGQVFNVSLDGNAHNDRLLCNVAKTKLYHINYLHDLLSWSLINTGCPFNAYDVTGLEITDLSYQPLANDITVNLIINQESKEYTLPAGCYVLMANSSNPLILGVPGIGVVSEYYPQANSNNLLVDTIIPDPEMIRRVNKTLKVKNELTTRCEKGINPYAIFDFYNSLCGLEGDLVMNHLAYHIKKPQIKTINFDAINTTYAVLGINIEPTTQLHYLNCLGLETLDASDLTNVVIKVPNWRFDVTNDHDLVEEIIRMYGVDRIASVSDVETIVSPSRLDHRLEQVANTISTTCLANGVNEVITYSLISEEQFNMFNPLNKEPIKLLSPLSLEHQVYRHSLIPSLLEVAQFNLDRQADTINYFEIANTYFGNPIGEHHHFAGVLGGIKEHHLDGSNKLFDFYDAKNILDQIANQLQITFTYQQVDSINIFNPYAQALLKVGDQTIGMIGIKHPDTYKKINLNVVCFELDLDLLLNYVNEKRIYAPINQLPIIKRNLTLIVNDDTQYQDITNIFNNIDNLASFQVNNIYRGENIESGKFSISFDINFNQPQALTKEDVEVLMQQIVDNAKKCGYIFNEA